MRKFLVLAAFSIGMMFVATTSVFAQSGEQSVYREALKKMLQCSGSLEASKMAFAKTFEMLRPQYPNVPDAFWEEQTTKVTNKFLDKMLEIYLPIYQKYLTQEDLNSIISFHESPVGKKLMEASPKIVGDVMDQSQKLAMEIVTEMMQEMQAKQKELQGSSKLE